MAKKLKIIILEESIKCDISNERKCYQEYEFAKKRGFDKLKESMFKIGLKIFFFSNFSKSALDKISWMIVLV